MTDKDWLISKLDLMKSGALSATCRWMLADPKFFIAPAAAKKHQAWTGGLALHTREVLDIALSMASADCVKEVVNLDVLIAGTLWHDYGKIWDYKRNEEVQQRDQKEPPQEWVYTRHRWTTYHLPRSYAEFLRAAQEFKCSDDEIEEVGHCILSHHGRQEYRSPVSPLSMEAMMIHFADSIDAFHVGKPHIFRVPRKDWKSV